MDKKMKAEGFSGQILHVLPPSLIERGHPLVQSLYITDIGWYPHAHYHFRERPEGASGNILIVCKKGAGWVEISKQRFRLAHGQALLIPRGMPHVYAAESGDPWSIHWFHFNGDAAQYYLCLLPDGDYRVPISPACLAELESVFKSTYSLLAESYSHANIVYLAQLAHHMLGLLFYRNAAYSPFLRAAASRDVRPTVDFIIQHCTEPLTRTTLARHAGLSVSHFSLVFQQQTGLSPMQFLIHQRIRRACQQMSTTSLTIREIAGEVGYDDPYYFSRLFRQTMGRSPRQYRKAHKG
jgi:AraC-like DNA-binding protein